MTGAPGSIDFALKEARAERLQRLQARRTVVVDELRRWETAILLARAPGDDLMSLRNLRGLRAELRAIARAIDAIVPP